ncbi:hypothetical protein DFS33DRAFT_130291 [Desarmillaria ectypa]|nr:hypothetical protein DFS33DRAFT_130291 [Desarmillaria ectypa]
MRCKTNRQIMSKGPRTSPRSPARYVKSLLAWCLCLDSISSIAQNPLLEDSTHALPDQDVVVALARSGYSVIMCTSECDFRNSPLFVATSATITSHPAFSLLDPTIWLHWYTVLQYSQPLWLYQITSYNIDLLGLSKCCSTLTWLASGKNGTCTLTLSEKQRPCKSEALVDIPYNYWSAELTRSQGYPTMPILDCE